MFVQIGHLVFDVDDDADGVWLRILSSGGPSGRELHASRKDIRRLISALRGALDRAVKFSKQAK